MKRSLVIMVILAGWAGVAQAAAAPTPAAPAPDLPAYTLEQCLEWGLARATVLANALRDEQIAGAVVTQARAQVLPQLGLVGDYAHTKDPAIAPESSSNQKADNLRGDAQLRQLLFSGGKAQAALDAARLYRDLRTRTTAEVRSTLVRDVRVQFTDILFIQRMVEVAGASVEQLEQLVAQARQKYEQEVVSEFDYLSAQVKLENERPKLIQARNALATTKQAFRNLVHLDAPDFLLQGELAYDPWPVDLPELQREALALRPALQAMEKRVALLGQDVRAARGDYWPTMHAVGVYSGTDPDRYDGSNAGLGWWWSVGATASWSLYDGGLRRGKVLEKGLELEKAKASLEQLRLDVALEIEQAYLKMEEARQTVQATGETVNLARKSLAIAKTRYDAGLATYLEYTDANHALNLAQVTWYGALRDHMNALAQLRYAAGLGDPVVDVPAEAAP